MPYVVDFSTVSTTGLESSRTSSRPRLKFVRQKSKLAGTIRGSYFVIKGER